MPQGRIYKRHLCNTNCETCFKSLQYFSERLVLRSAKIRSLHTVQSTSARPIICMQIGEHLPCPVITEARLRSGPWSVHVYTVWFASGVLPPWGEPGWGSNIVAPSHLSRHITSASLYTRVSRLVLCYITLVPGSHTAFVNSHSTLHSLHFTWSHFLLTWEPLASLTFSLGLLLQGSHRLPAALLHPPRSVWR